MTASEWITHLDLKPHPEGGYYRETYRSPMRIAVPSALSSPDTADSADVDQTRNVSTAIYFLLEGDQVSTLHRIKSDEIWHFYAGSTLMVQGIHPDGTHETWRLGLNLLAGDCPQCIVPADTWFGAHLADPAGYALVGCTVSPGFDFEDFEMADRAKMLSDYPDSAEIIVRLTR